MAAAINLGTTKNSSYAMAASRNKAIPRNRYGEKTKATLPQSALSAEPADNRAIFKYGCPGGNCMVRICPDLSNMAAASLSTVHTYSLLYVCEEGHNHTGFILSKMAASAAAKKV